MDPFSRFSRALEAVSLPSTEVAEATLAKTSEFRSRLSDEQNFLLSHLIPRIRTVKAQFGPKCEDVRICEAALKKINIEVLDIRKAIESRSSSYGTVGTVSGGLKLATWVGTAITSTQVFAFTFLTPPVAAASALFLTASAVFSGAAKETLKTETDLLKTYIPKDLDKILKEESLEEDPTSQVLNWTDRDKMLELGKELSKLQKNVDLSTHVYNLIDLYDQYAIGKAHYDKISKAAENALDNYKKEKGTADKFLKDTNLNTVWSNIYDNIKELPTNIKGAFETKKRPQDEIDDAQEDEKSEGDQRLIKRKKQPEAEKAS